MVALLFFSNGLAGNGQRPPLGIKRTSLQRLADHLRDVTRILSYGDALAAQVDIAVQVEPLLMRSPCQFGGKTLTVLRGEAGFSVGGAPLRNGVSG